MGEKKNISSLFSNIEDLYKNLTDLASTLSQEYDPETSYSPFRDESYSPSRTYDDPKCAIISNEYDPDSYNEYNPSVLQNEGSRKDYHETKPTLPTNARPSRRSCSPYNPRPNVNYHETNCHLPKNTWTRTDVNSSKRSRSPSFISSYDEYNPTNHQKTQPRREYNSHLENSLALVNIRTDVNSSKRSRSPSFKSSNFQNKRQARKESRHEVTAFVCNIAFTISEEELKEFFESKVRIQSFKLVDQKNEQGKLCKRFAFVSTFTETDFQTLLSFHDVKVDNRKLCIRKSDKK